MQRPSEEILHGLKAKYGAVLEFELPDFEFAAILTPFNLASCARFVDEGVVSIDDASDRLLVRHVVWPPPVELQTAKKRCAKLAKRIADTLSEDAGLPVTAPAMRSSDRLTSSTPPGVLAQAGLDENTAAELLAAHPDARLQIVVVTDSTSAVIFACVLTSESDVALGLLRDAQERKKGYAAATLSAARACIVWSRGDLDQSLERYPAIHTLVLPSEINDLGGGDAVKRFRRRQ